MGTTRTALQSNATGIRVQFVVAIEGYANLITDGPTAGAITAWAGTEWSAAIGGLEIQWDWKQQFKPWDATLDVDGLSFSVQDCDGLDAFGIAVFGTGAGVETYLNESLPAYASGASTINVLSTSLFAASGTIWIGNEEIAYTGKSATQFTGCTRGRHSPFKMYAETAMRSGRPHPLPVFDSVGTVVKPKVTSLPRVWRGRNVGIWMHRVVGGVLDVQAQAQSVFQGRIREYRDTESGPTVIDCDDARVRLKETVLLNDQWSAAVSEGIFLRAGVHFSMSDVKNGTARVASDLVVVTSGASTLRILEGFYTVDDLADVFQAWWSAEYYALRLNLLWRWDPRYVDSADLSLHSRFHWTNGHATGLNLVAFKAPNDHLNRFMGFGQTAGVIQHQWQGSTTDSLVSPETPYRIYIPDGASQIDLQDVHGTWINNRDYFPAEMAINPTNDGFFGTSSFGILQINGDGPMALFDANSATSPTAVFQEWLTPAFLAALTGEAVISASDREAFLRVRLDDEGEHRLRQVFIAGGSLTSLMVRLMASTGSAGYNGVYDVYPAQLGAGIQWDLLGTQWLESAGAISEGQASLILVIEKPTLLSEVLACELIARTSSVVLKGGGFKIASWGTPIAAQATHALTASNKASPIDAKDRQVTVAQEDDSALVNVIKLEYNRTLRGGYRDVVTIRHVASISDLGVEKAITISMRNTFTARGSSAYAIDGLRAILISAIQMFAYPLRRLHRTVDLTLMEGIAPGDFGSISDGFARNPETGARSITTRAHLLLSHHVDWGGYESASGGTRPMLCEVEVMILPQSNISAYCPSAEVDIAATNGGYVVATKVLTCLPHEHSLASELADATRFVTGDKVRIVELDPTDPANPETWIDTVASQSGNTITLTTGYAGWTSTLYHRILSDTYTTAVAAQKANVYQADDADGMIADVTSPYVFGAAPQQGGAWAAEQDTGAELPALYATVQSGDGTAYDTGAERDVARLCNNLVSYRTAANVSTLGAIKAAGASALGVFVRRVVEVIPLHFGPGALHGGDRLVRLRPWYRRGVAGAAAILRATLCRGRPIGYTWTITNETAPEYVLVGPTSVAAEWSATDTTWGAGEFKELSIKAALQTTGIGYLVVEAEPDVETRGMSEIFLLQFAQ